MTRYTVLVVAVMACVASNHATDEDDEIEPDYAACCECLAESETSGVTCLQEQIGECEAALENDDSITVLDGCIEESCENSCAFLTRSDNDD